MRCNFDLQMTVKSRSARVLNKLKACVLYATVIRMYELDVEQCNAAHGTETCGVYDYLAIPDLSNRNMFCNESQIQKHF